MLVIVCCFPPLHPSVVCFRLMTLRRGAGSGTSIIFYINDIFITAVVWNALPERSVSPEERSGGPPRAEESPRSNLPGSESSSLMNPPGPPGYLRLCSRVWNSSSVPSRHDGSSLGGGEGLRRGAQAGARLNIWLIQAGLDLIRQTLVMEARPRKCCIICVSADPSSASCLDVHHVMNGGAK